MTSPISPALLDEILAGCEGVTPGPWAYRPKPSDDWGMVRNAEGWLTAIARAGQPLSEVDKDDARGTGRDPYRAHAIFIAMCDPDTIRSIILRLKAVEAALASVLHVAAAHEPDAVAVREARALSTGASHELV